MSSSSNPTEAAYKSAVKKLGLKSNIARALEIPDRELKVEISARRDNGEIDSVQGTEFSTIIEVLQRGNQVPSPC